ncbi:MAG: DNA mismatch repair endonuclease MutL [Clostridia bacterium]
MGNIVLLDDLTINKIAAGEVIERPASVIKEMVENSIDAGATNITVEIKNGGISYIKVSDNGKGIAQDDLEIAFERHATSKIRSANDLDTVTSMGFRGEALASIAAIANVEMVSKTQEQDIGYRVVVEAGNVLEKEEAGCKTGTTITVRNLFFNTPVRYKFLKKDYTESGYIEDVVTRIALVNPNIAIKLINTGKTVIQTNGSGQIKNVIYSIYGKDIANGIMEVAYKYEDIKITGVVGKPEIARSNRTNQLFFVNKRYIKDKILRAATEQAYKGLIPIGKFGFVILNIDMSPAKVDVNVHPAKLEVRFEEENKIFQSIYHAIKDTLLKTELVANSEKSLHNEQEGKTQATGRELPFEERLKKLKEEKQQRQNSEGLFAFRKQNTKQIENYTNEESKIKTNVIEDVYNNHQKEEESKKIGEPIDTSDILMQLKQMKENLENELKEKGVEVKNTLKLAEDKVNYKINQNFEDQPIEQKVNNENNPIEENQKEKPEKKIEETENLENKEITEEKDTEKEQIVENQPEEVPKNETEDNTEEIIEQIENPEIKQEFKEIKEKMEQLNDNPQVVSEDFNEMYTKLFGRPPIQDEPENEEPKEKDIDILKDNVSVFEGIEEYKKPVYKFIGIVFKTYIILEIDKEMYILDQHAAHERIMYEKVKQNYYSETGKDSQLLLLPDVITLTHKEMDIAKENMEMFRKAGFTLEEFGENTIKLTGVPTVCIDLDNKDLFLETLDEINTVARTAKQEKEEKFIATVACKAAVKANMALDTKEVESLMDKLLALPNPFTCPHGRPTAIKMTKYDIERKFARK